MTVKELAAKANVTERRVYQIARYLGRLPTVEEIESRKGKKGRPKKYKEGKSQYVDLRKLWKNLSR